MLSLGEESSTKMWDAFLRQLMEASLVRQFIVKHEKNHINTTGKFSDKECDPYLLTCPLKINTFQNISVIQSLLKSLERQNSTRLQMRP